MFPVWIPSFPTGRVILSRCHWSHFSTLRQCQGTAWGWGSKEKDDYWAPTMSQTLGFASAILFEIIRRCLSICFYSTKIFKLLQIIIRHRSKVDTFFAFKMFRPSEGTLRKQMCSWLARWKLKYWKNSQQRLFTQLQGAVGAAGKTCFLRRGNPKLNLEGWCWGVSQAEGQYES